MNAPLYNTLIEYHKKNRISFAMPGHKNGRGLAKDLICCDVTELDATDDLHRPREAVKESQRLLAKLYGAEESYILTCGSTAGIQAAVTAALNPGETLLAASDCHMSVINTCALIGVKLRLIPRAVNEEFLIPTGALEIEDMLDKYSDIKAVLVTSPNYYGICADAASLAEICHARNIPLLVDEAHGAHFIADERLPESAAPIADAVCQSAHKTLNALTGAAYLHVNGNLINRARLESALSMFQTSSPSYVIAASADTARAELESGGDWKRAVDLAAEFKRAVKGNTKIKVFENDDITRIVLNFGAYDTTGFNVSKELSEKYGIDIEMADLANIVLIVTPSNNAEDFAAMFDALRQITRGLKECEKPPEIGQPSVCDDLIDPKAAFFAESETARFTESENRVSRRTVTAYPPGTPIILTGGKITRAQIEYVNYLRSIGAEITGIENGEIEVVK